MSEKKWLKEAKRNACELETLSENPVGQVEHCPSCGSYTLHVSHVSVRFDRRGLLGIEEALRAALLRVSRANRRGPGPNSLDPQRTGS